MNGLSKLALLFGGAISVGGVAHADVGKVPARVPQQSVKTFGDSLIWSDAGRIFLRESGQPAHELVLGDTSEARQLRQLLTGATVDSPRVIQDSIVLVGGGGAGYNWQPPQQQQTAQPPQTARNDRPPASWMDDRPNVQADAEADAAKERK